jgi:agmatinase
MTYVSVLSKMTDTEVPMIDADTPSFMGLPVARTKADLTGADIAIIGVPYDTPPSAGRDPNSWAGFRTAPRVTRINSMRYAGYLPEFDLDVLEHLRVVDYGDAEIVADVKQSTDNVIRKVEEAIEAGVRPITLGGFSPCASYAVAGGIANRTDGKVGTISLDAHGDCVDRSLGKDGSREPNGSTWEARMWDHFANIDPTRHCEIGMRGPRNRREMVEKYRNVGARLFTSAEVHRRGIEAITSEALDGTFAGASRTWFHFDMDVLDIGAVPEWGDEPLGLSARECIHVVHEAGKRGLSGLSFVFVAPQPGTSAIAIYACVYYMAGLVLGGFAGKKA